MSTSAKGKRSIEEFIEAAEDTRSRRKGKTSEQTSETTESKVVSEKFENIQENPFYKIIFSEGDPEAKKEEVAKMLAFDKDKPKDENKETLKQFEKFKEWLMHERKQMAEEIIRLTDTDTFAELKDVFDHMVESLNDFNNQMQPLTDILDAVYTLRTAQDGTMFDVLSEIREDKEREEQLAEQRAKQEEELTKLEEEITGLNTSIRVSRNDKKFFGFGGITDTAQKNIARAEVEIENRRAEMDKLRTAIQESTSEAAKTSEFGEFAAEKEKLRQLLDISSDQHKARQEALVAAAQKFVTTSDERSHSVLESVREIGNQIDRLGDSNGGMQSVYAIISDAVKDAEIKNDAVRKEFEEPEGEESNIAKMKRERMKVSVDEHATALTAAKVDTMGTFADLTAESYRIKSMKDSNDKQVNKMQTLHSQGVAGVASRLSTVLTGVSMAALTESSEVATMTLERMNKTTTDLSLKESLKNAMGIRDQNDQLTKAIEELESYGKVARTATGITRDGLQEMKANLEDLQKTAQEVGAAVKDAIAVNADVMYGDTPANENARQREDKPRASAPKPSPFSNV